MFNGYLKIAVRRLLYYRIYSLINVAGLAMGLCCCLVIGLIVQYEFSFDHFHADKKRIYQVNTMSRFSAEDKAIAMPAVLPPLAAQLHSVSGVETMATYHILADAKATIENSNRQQVSFQAAPVFTSKDYFSIMQYHWLAGSRESSLEEPFTAVLTLQKAQLYFGKLPATQFIGRIILYNDSIRVRVTGVLQDWVYNTDFPYQEFISIQTVKQPFVAAALQLDHSKGLSGTTRVLLKLDKLASPAAVDSAVGLLFSKNWADEHLTKVVLQPLTAIHFAGNAGQAGSPVSKLSVLYALISIAVFILLLAIINYTNLATAQAVSRSRETGIRKILGGSRTGLFFQFLTETAVLTVIASIVAVLLVNPVLALFREFIAPQVKFNPLATTVLVFLAGVIVITSLLAGAYPAKMQSSGKALDRLKGNEIKGGRKFFLRKSLIVFQFTISLLFIVCTLVISSQIKFMTGKETGFNSDTVILLSSPAGGDVNTSKLLEQHIGKLSGVQATARQNMPPMGLDHGFFTITYAPQSEEPRLIAAIKADENYIPLYNIPLLAGRNLTSSDTLKEFVINETYSKLLGFKKPADALGKMLFTWEKNAPIVGVVADFHQFSFHEAIKPQVITALRCEDLAVKLQTSGKSREQTDALIAAVEKEWKTVYPHEPFNFEFLDASIAAMYKKELATSWLMQVATAMTIFISCLGLMGLTLFSVEKRTKEIGIRKVLGAGVFTIVAMLIGELLLLVGIAFVVAVPLATWYMHGWLQDFAYRVSISWPVFAGTGLMAVLIVVSAVGWQALKAARANPVNSLRSE